MRKFNKVMAAAATSLSLLIFCTPAAAASGADEAAGRLQTKPILDARGRYETVDQSVLGADALTLRLRAGAEVSLDHFSLLADAEVTVAPLDKYNALPFPLPGERQWRPKHAVVADPENAELNRLQLQYKLPHATFTVGRQRINIDDQRWVGSVGWRQNEQTFDAVRMEASSDLTYAVSQRTIFGKDAGPRTAYDGDFLFGGISAPLGPFKGKLFAYLLSYGENSFLPNSSQTQGGVLTGSTHLGGRKLALQASYARQSDFGDNPFDYAADYWSFEGSTALAGFTVSGGWERLGTDNGRAVQTPMATLHKFNGWADMFLTTPASGLEDSYFRVGRKFGSTRLLPGFSVNAAFHQFDSAAGDIEYGTEWDAAIGFRAAKLDWLLKFADYDSNGFGADTRKLWIQAEWSL